KKGMQGGAEIAAMMENYRKQPPAELGGSPVAQLLDYETSEGKNLATGETWTIDLPKSNVLQFILEDGSRISARPSGTEPKIKFYFSVNSKLDSADKFTETHQKAKEKIRAIITDMKIS